MEIRRLAIRNRLNKPVGVERLWGMTNAGWWIDVRKMWRTAAVAIGILAWSGQEAKAALAGAWETFFDQTNADAWLVDDYVSATLLSPLWMGTPVDEEYVYFAYNGDNPVSFIADAYVGDGEFVGDYRAEKISGVSCQVYIGNLSVLDLIDCGLFASGPGGDTYYYSEVFVAEDFDGNGWWVLLFDFDQPWYYYDGTKWIAVNAKLLTGIKELSINFYPVANSAGGSFVGIDEVAVEPTVTAPKLSTSLVAGAPGSFRLAFTPGPGTQCRVEKMGNPPLLTWNAMVGEIGIKGPGEHVFLRPLQPTAEVFRVGVDPFYTAVVSPAPAP